MSTERVTGVILAGGQSRRFGSDKASALLAGRPLLQWVVDAVQQSAPEILVVAAKGQALPPIDSAVPLRVTFDSYDASGPLAGMVTAFEETTTPIALVVSCDAPLLEPAVLRLLIERIGDSSAILPRVGGRLQPLVAVYRVADCMAPFRDCVEGGTLRILDAVGALEAVEIVDEADVRALDPELRSFRGVNTAEELARAAALLG